MTLQTIWFLLWGVLWAIYFILDGFDLGIGTLLPWIGKTQTDRRIMMNAMGPFWDGNEVWLITAGGVTFAAFPGTYATLFSAMYSALMLVLLCLIFRGVAMEFRSKGESDAWRRFWDRALFVSSSAGSILFGVAFFNVFRGIPIDADGVMQGSLFTLLNPYGLLGGILFLSLFAMHGALYLAIRTTGDLYERAIRTAQRLWVSSLVLVVAAVGASAGMTGLPANYRAHPVLLVIPALCVGSLIVCRRWMGHRPWGAWAASGVNLAGLTFFGLAGIYPAMLPSTLDASFSRTISNAASTPLTLKIMLGVVIVVIPTVIAYQAFAYRLMSHRLTEADLDNEHAY
ncbi:cytochrome d ubiquinol oxidase subunit II [bacterium]|nr:cytochrome d ubiquinol oxidase subunit II [candidate division CSSED10-310 bacterium]